MFGFVLCFICVLLVDDYELVCDGICVRFMKVFDIEIVGEVMNGEEVVCLIQEYVLDVFLMDVFMFLMNGLEVVIWIRQDRLEVVVLILLVYDNFEYV